MFVFAVGGFIVLLCWAAAEDWFAGRQTVSRDHVLARPELRSGVSVKADVETEPLTPQTEEHEIHSWEADILLFLPFLKSCGSN